MADAAKGVSIRTRGRADRSGASGATRESGVSPFILKQTCRAPLHCLSVERSPRRPADFKCRFIVRTACASMMPALAGAVG